MNQTSSHDGTVTSMASDSLHLESAARNAALARLREEHRCLARVIEAMETVIAEVAETHAVPDFPLLASMLYYVDAVPERLHHPKEDRFLFAVLRQCDPDSAALIGRLERDHQRSGNFVGELERALVHWQGGAPDGSDEFVLALGRFCEFSWGHMRTEESEILPRAERALREADWLAMADAFGANDDPLFGVKRQQQFERLYHRIVNLTPRTLWLGRLRSEHSRS